MFRNHLSLLQSFCRQRLELGFLLSILKVGFRLRDFGHVGLLGREVLWWI